MVYKRYITDKNGIKRGPYYYANVRENGKVKSIYLGMNPPEVPDPPSASFFSFNRSVIAIIIMLVLFGIGGIAAVVGGLGVLNTMIMSVMERRREIGVMKAIGATRFAILKQILTESILISAIGGLIGIALGVMAAVGLNMVVNPLRVPNFTVEQTIQNVSSGLEACVIGLALN